jgi:hypothetical protein
VGEICEGIQCGRGGLSDDKRLENVPSVRFSVSYFRNIVLNGLWTAKNQTTQPNHAVIKMGPIHRK